MTALRDQAEGSRSTATTSGDERGHPESTSVIMASEQSALRMETSFEEEVSTLPLTRPNGIAGEACQAKMVQESGVLPAIHVLVERAVRDGEAVHARVQPCALHIAPAPVRPAVLTSLRHHQDPNLVPVDGQRADRHHVRGLHRSI